MSSILKAIRKIEDEKRVGENKAPDLMIDHGRATPNGRSLSLVSLVAGVLLGGALVGALFVLYKSDGPEAQKDLSQKPLAMPDQNRIATKVMVDSTDTGKDSATSIPSSPPRQSKATEVATDEVKKIEPVKQPEIKPEVAKASIVESTPTNEKQVVRLPTPVEAVPTVVPAKPAVSLKVSEIFYQEDSANSMAVVNDLPVMVGTHVESAIVKAIQPEEVVFEISGQSISVPVSQP